jgi:hypothetical protein
MLRFFADGELRHRLEDAAGRHVGWIRRHTIGFLGFASEHDAIAAAVDAWRGLESVLRRHYSGWPRFELELDELRLVHDGAHEWISDGRVPLARLIRPRADEASGGAFAIEFVLPSYATEGVAIAAAQMMARALDEHSLRRDAAPAFAGQPPAYFATEPA